MASQYEITIINIEKKNFQLKICLCIHVPIVPAHKHATDYALKYNNTITILCIWTHML